MATSTVAANLGAGAMPQATAGMNKLGVPVQNNGGMPSVSPIFSSTAFSVPSAISGGGTPLLPTGGVPGAVSPPAETPSPLAGQTAKQNQELNKQLVDTFGKGEGNLLNTEIGNLGSADSSYMQAYEKAMQQPNAENLATLNTTLGNEGVSGDSSTAAIANADYQTGITNQEGLQEQQLQMNDEQNLLGLTQGLEGQSAAEVASGGFLNDIGSVLGAVGSVASSFLGGGGLSSLLPSAKSNPVQGISPTASGAGNLEPSTSSLSDLII